VNKEISSLLKMTFRLKAEEGVRGSSCAWYYTSTGNEEFSLLFGL
jgi:hypothetical protein